MKTRTDKVGDLKDYKKNAKEGCDLMFRVSLKGKSHLEREIPLHMSIKIFKSIEEANLDKIKSQVNELKLTERPDPKQLKFKNTIFTGRDGNQYYMLMIEGLNPKFKEFYDSNKDRGTVYDNGFMPHITINKELYDEIEKDGIKPEDVEFGPLLIEEGAGNTHHEFEVLEKSAKSALAALGAVATMATASPTATAAKVAPIVEAPAPKPMVQADPYNSDRMLRTIASVESSGGKDIHHKMLASGEAAFGRYALTPNVIRETIHMHKDLNKLHQKATLLRGQEMVNYLEDNPGLEDTVAKRHLKRLEHHFGQDPEKIGYAWLEGIRGTYKAIREKQPIHEHWHVKKIRDAYSKGDKHGQAPHYASRN